MQEAAISRLSFPERMKAFEPVPWKLIPDLGLYMDQVITYIERRLEPLYGARAKELLTPSMINNYVKLGLLSRPQGKKYSREHLALLMMIVSLKPVTSMDNIARLTALREGQTVQQLYEEFLQTQQQVIQSISASSSANALQNAVTAAAYRLVTESMLEEDTIPPNA